MKRILIVILILGCSGLFAVDPKQGELEKAVVSRNVTAVKGLITEGVKPSMDESQGTMDMAFLKAAGSDEGFQILRILIEESGIDPTQIPGRFSYSVVARYSPQNSPPPRFLDVMRYLLSKNVPFLFGDVIIEFVKVADDSEILGTLFNRIISDLEKKQVAHRAFDALIKRKTSRGTVPITDLNLRAMVKVIVTQPGF